MLKALTAILKSVSSTLHVLNPVSILYMLSVLQVVLTEAQSRANDSGPEFVLDFPGDGSTYLPIQSNDIERITNRFGVANSSYQFRADSYFYAEAHHLPANGSQTLSWWMRNASAGNIISYGINIQINQQYLNNQSGSAYACPGLNGYLSIAYGENLVCGGWKDSSLNNNLYLGYGDDTWTQYAITLTDFATVVLYINGSALTKNLTMYAEPPAAASAPYFTLGNALSGQLDTLRVYARALNASELLANFIFESTPPGVINTLPSSSGMSGGASSSANSVVSSSRISSSKASASVSSSITSDRASSSISSSVTSARTSSSVSSLPSSSIRSSLTSSSLSSSASSSVSSISLSSSISSSTVSASSSLTFNSVPSSSSSSSSNDVLASTDPGNGGSSDFPPIAKIVFPVVGGAAILACAGIFAMKRRHPVTAPAVEIMATRNNVI